MTRSVVAPLFTILILFAVPSGRADTLQNVQSHILSGDRDRAREMLDSLLIAPSIDDNAREEGSFLRALLEEDGDLLERRLRLLRGGDLSGDRRARVDLLLGRLAFSRGRFLDAMEHFSNARNGGRKEEGSLWGGLAAMGAGDGGPALDLLKRAAASGNSRFRQRAWIAIGDVHRSSGRFKDALEAYDAVRASGLEGPGWWGTATYRSAECLRQLNRESEAVARLRELLSTAPDCYEAPAARAAVDATVIGSGSPGAEDADEPATAAPAFALQAGAFSDPGNAEQLARKLKDRGFPRVRVVEGNAVHRVLVGSFPLREEAEALGDSLMSVLESGFSVVRIGDR